ncbi:MAG: hypothetical protein HWE27_12025 [Gammaproteobacteria bacterium]|nr:hypothetical protein [Gammaproteobacteria bacterium]
MKLKLYAIATLLGAMSSLSFAIDKKISCSNCSVSSHQFLAKQAAPRHLDSSRVHIVDKVRKTLHSYEVIRERDVGPVPIYFVVPTGTPNHIYNEFIAYKNALNEFEVLKNMIDPVPPHIASSAWDMVKDPAARQRVGNWFQSNHYIYSQVSSLINLATGWASPLLTLKFEFADGSYAIFEYRNINSNGDLYYEFIGGQSLDADGNTIELYGQRVDFGTSRNSRMALNDFLAAAARAGIPIIVNGGPLGPVPTVCRVEGDSMICQPATDSN